MTVKSSASLPATKQMGTAICGVAFLTEIMELYLENLTRIMKTKVGIQWMAERTLLEISEKCAAISCLINQLNLRLAGSIATVHFGAVLRRHSGARSRASAVKMDSVGTLTAAVSIILETSSMLFCWNEQI